MTSDTSEKTRNQTIKVKTSLVGDTSDKIGNQTTKMETSLVSEASDSIRQPHLPQTKIHHHHVPKVFALSDITPEESYTNQQQDSKGIIQLVRRGEGKDRMMLSNFVTKDGKDKTEKKLSLHRPILVRDTPESIGMKIPKGRKRKRKWNDYSSSKNTDSVSFSIRDVADAVGHSSPVQVIDVLTQELDENLSDWTFRDLVEYFEGKERVARNKSAMTDSQEKSPVPVSPTGRSRRKAAIRSQESTNAIIHDEKSSSEASTQILNQISYEFSGTPLHPMVESPQIVRDIDWIDQAWPNERKPKDKESKHPKRSKTGKTSKKASKGENSTEYPAVQYYCLTSAAGSYTDFHIDFGGSSVWYHIVRGQKVFVVSPPTHHNLKVYEEWLCHADQAKIFLPDMMEEKACPDIHRSPTNTLSTNNALRFTLNAGETLILPAGWIHAVYTPVDSLVFGGNFLHGMDIQMQLTVNDIEARTRVLHQYRFPHFGTLQMYAGGMYLKRLRAMEKDETKAKRVSGDSSNEIDSETGVSPRELEELPILIDALECWWLSQQKSEENNNKEVKEKKANARDSRSYDSITSHSSFRDAAEYVVQETGCRSVEDFIIQFRNEYGRISNEQWWVASSDNPLAIERPKSRSKTGEQKKKKGKPSRKRNRKGTTDLDDPLDIVLSKQVKEYLASIQITTAAQLLLARTSDVGKAFPAWRRKKGLKELKTSTGAVASVSTWKRKVRMQAALVGANKLAHLNEAKNTKPLTPPKNNTK